MQDILLWLRKLGPLGSLFARVISFLTTNWWLLVATAISTWTAISDWAMAIVAEPRVQAWAQVFLVLMWSCIGLLYLVDRKRPKVTKSAEDYKYGLTFEGLIPFWEPANAEAALQFGIALRNFSSGPIQYTVESFDVRIGTRSLPKLQKDALKSYMSRGAGRVSSNIPFPMSDIAEFLGKRAKGTVDFAIAYGHPERLPERRLVMELEIVLVLGEAQPPSLPTLGFNNRILNERDQAI